MEFKISDAFRKALKENAKDCLRYGLGKPYWNTCGVEHLKTLNQIWNEAKRELAEDF